jgi:hypothetical protein
MNLLAISPSIRCSRFLVNTVSSQISWSSDGDKPAEQQILFELLHQLPLRSLVSAASKVGCGACVTKAPSEYDGAELYER